MWLSAWRIVAFISAISAVIFISVAPQTSNDFWLQAKVGELIVRDHAIPKTLLFPFTEIQSARFNAHEWLPSILFYGLVNVWGEGSLPFVLGALGLAFFAVAVFLAYTRSFQSLPLALGMGLVAIAVENYRHFLRPELISLLLLGIFLILLERFRKGATAAKWIAILIVMVLWSNTHGSFVLGPIIAAIFAVGTWIDARLHRMETIAHPLALVNYALLVPALLVCTLVNPFGWEQLAFVLNFTRSSFTSSYVQEWASTFNPIVWNWRGFWIGFVIAATTALMAIVYWRRMRASDALLFLAFLALAMKSARFIVYLGLISAFVLPALFSSKLISTKWQSIIYALCTFAALATLGLAMKFGNAYGAYPHYSDINASFSKPMLTVLSNPSIRGNTLTTFDYGAELVYRAYPRMRPSLDSRIDSYGEDYLLFTERLLRDDMLLTKFVAEYDVRYMLLTLPDFQLVQQLPSWKIGLWTIYLADSNAVLLQRSDLR